jgi:branched-subunit amino acid ABC-type transport system permease component
MLFVFQFLSQLSVILLIAFSLGLIFDQLGIINLAQGDFVMVGAYVMYAFRHEPFLVGVGAAVVVGFVLAAVLERVVMRRLYGRGFMAALLATWGIGIVLRQLANAWWTSTPRSINLPIGGSVTVLGTSYPVYRLVVMGAVVVILAAVLYVAYGTSLGLRVRACIDNLEMASVLGASPARMFMLVFVSGGVLAVLAGALVAPVIGATPTVGLSYLAPAFFAVLLGRPGTIGGPVFGAVLVALLVTTLNRYFTATVAQSLLFGALVLLIALRPEGVKWTLPSRMTPVRPKTSRVTG